MKTQLKSCLRLSVAFFLLFALSSLKDLNAQTITRDDNNNSATDYVCLVISTVYNINVANTAYTNCLKKWVATGGDIIGADNGSSVTVAWGDTPGGTVSLKCTLSGCTDADGDSITGKDVTFTNQLILSVKNQNFSGSSSQTVSIDWCTTKTLTLPFSMYVQGTGGIA